MTKVTLTFDLMELTEEDFNEIGIQGSKKMKEFLETQIYPKKTIAGKDIVDLFFQSNLFTDVEKIILHVSLQEIIPAVMNTLR